MLEEHEIPSSAGNGGPKLGSNASIPHLGGRMVSACYHDVAGVLLSCKPVAVLSRTVSFEYGCGIDEKRGERLGL